MMLKLEGARNLNEKEQKKVMGGKPVQPANCSCFCYINNQKRSAYCFDYCPDGSIPGLNPGSTGNCAFPILP